MTVTGMRSEGSGVKALTVPFLFLIAAVAIAFFSTNHADPDLWGHLEFGKYMWEHRTIPRHDLYSYAAAGAPWTNHEWLSEVVLYGIFRFAGSAGLILFKTIIGCCIAGLLAPVVLRATTNLWIRLLIIPSLAVVAYGFALRPQLFTYLFFTATLFLIIRRDASGDDRWLLPLPVICALWVNFHGGFVTGVGMILLYAGCMIATRRLTPALGAITLASLAATLVNPYGFGIWRFVSYAVPMPRPYISEWDPVGLDLRHSDYYLVILIALVAYLFTRTKRTAFELLLLGAALYFSLRHKRHIMLFAIPVAFYAPRHLASFLPSGARFFAHAVRRRIVAAGLLLAAGIFLGGALVWEKTDPLKIEIKPKDFPMSAIAFLRANNLTGNAFVWFDWGELAIRELPGEHKVFIDGRYETVYTPALIRDYFDVLLCKKDYTAYLANFPETDIMFLNKFLPITERIINDPAWILVYSPPVAVILLKDNEHNKEALERFRRGEFVYPMPKPPYYFREEERGTAGR